MRANSPVPSKGDEPADEWQLRVAEPDDAAAIAEVIHAAFGARPPLDPPSTAGAETAETVRAALDAVGGVVVEIGHRVAGVILVATLRPGVAGWRRVSVHPDFWGHGLGTELVAAAEEFAAERGYREVELIARRELHGLVGFWNHRGYAEITRDGDHPYEARLMKQLPAAVWVPTAEAMQALGRRLAGVLRAGDVVLASGDLGAGKTTMTQGIGEAMGVAEAVISPTFVLSRIHPSTTGGPTLVHVDAYRLHGLGELEDIDLDASLAESVTVIEWGRGAAEGLTDHRLEVDILRGEDGEDDRLVLVRGVGARWAGVDLAAIVAASDAGAEEGQQ